MRRQFVCGDEASRCRWPSEILLELSGHFYKAIMGIAAGVD